jgi:hypothetical protein
MVDEGKTYYDPHSIDWINLVDNDDTKWDNVPTLKPEVMQWLADNTPNVDGEKGWCVGNDEYRKADSISLCVFFKKRNDAMKFIKRWSIHKNPVNYLNYFKDVRRKLNFKTGRLSLVKNKKS